MCDQTNDRMGGTGRLECLNACPVASMDLLAELQGSRRIKIKHNHQSNSLFGVLIRTVDACLFILGQ